MSHAAGSNGGGVSRPDLNYDLAMSNPVVREKIENLNKRIDALKKENALLRNQVEKFKIARWRDAGCPIGDGE